MKPRRPKGYSRVKDLITCKDCTFSRPYRPDHDYVMDGLGGKPEITCVLTTTAVSKNGTCHSVERKDV